MAVLPEHSNTAYQTTQVSTRYKEPKSSNNTHHITKNLQKFIQQKIPQSPLPSVQKFQTSKASFKDSSDKLATSIIAFSAACNAARLRLCASCRAARFSATLCRRAAQRWLRRCCAVVTRHCWAVAPLWTPSKALLKASSMLDKVASIERRCQERFNIDDCG